MRRIPFLADPLGRVSGYLRREAPGPRFDREGALRGTGDVGPGGHRGVTAAASLRDPRLVVENTDGAEQGAPHPGRYDDGPGPVGQPRGGAAPASDPAGLHLCVACNGPVAGDRAYCVFCLDAIEDDLYERLARHGW